MKYFLMYASKGNSNRLAWMSPPPPHPTHGPVSDYQNTWAQCKLSNQQITEQNHSNLQFLAAKAS